MDFIKKNIALVLGLSIPVAMIVLVAAAVYLPGMFIKPHTNFVYSLGDYYYNDCQKYDTADGRILLRTASSTNCNTTSAAPKLYIYDVTEKKSSEITDQTAPQLAVNDTPESPDGFTIKTGTGAGSDFLFFGGSNYDYNSQFLVGHGYSTKLNIPKSDYYNNQFRFLGWITQ